MAAGGGLAAQLGKPLRASPASRSPKYTTNWLILKSILKRGFGGGRDAALAMAADDADQAEWFDRAHLPSLAFRATQTVLSRR